MGKYIGKRILLLVPAVFLVCVIVFALMRLVPGDAVDSIIYKYSSMGISADRAGIYRSFPGSDSTSTGVTARETAAAAVISRQSFPHCRLFLIHFHMEKPVGKPEKQAEKKSRSSYQSRCNDNSRHFFSPFLFKP